MRTGNLIAFISLAAILQTQAQHAYVDLSFDPNKAFGIVDNKRTATDHRGLDFDLELGYSKHRWAWFVYFGAFPDADYQNYGVGTDFKLAGKKLEWWAGASLGAVTLQRSQEENQASGSWLAGSLRSLLYLRLFPNFGVTGRGQFQVRPDIPETGIFEGNLGIRFFFN